MKRLLLNIVLFLFFTSFISAQWIKKDTLLNNVVRIEDKNVGQIGNKYLVDIPLFLGNTNLTIFNNSSLPDSLLFTPAIDICPVDFLLISPNKTKNKKETKYYKVHISSIYGGSDWRRQDIEVDSTSLPSDEEPKLFFHSALADSNRVAFFCAEGHGSMLNSYETTNDFKEPSIWDFIKNYENNCGIKISPKVFTSGPQGYEGEYTSYIILEGLTPEQTLEFLLEQEKVLREAYGLKAQLDPKKSPTKSLYIPRLANIRRNQVKQIVLDIKTQ